MRLICIIVFFISCDLYAQNNIATEDIAVLARSYRDSISLRWAPTTYSIWRSGNLVGYTIERYTLMRNKVLLNTPEKKILTAVSLKPQIESDWETLVKRNRYAAVAAQALFGDDFEIDIQQSDLFQVVNKVSENEQRFAFALFSADMSAEVARASALIFTDRQTKYDERYLYRVVIYDQTDTLRGSIFMEPEYIVPLPRPENLKVSFQEKSAMLQWNKMSVNNMYTAYRIERSIDGKEFSAPSEVPATTFSSTIDHDSPYEYYTDSIPDATKRYYYRVLGVNPFGEFSLPSEVVSGSSVIHVDDVPMIFTGENIDNHSIQIQWEFPEESNKLIQGFDIERGLNAKGPFLKLKQIGSDYRKYIDTSPSQVNYYRINALQADGQALTSPPFLVQLIDSIPPIAPTALKAIVDEFGHVSISWAANKENDLYGYRIYKANFNNEEFSQVTSGPIEETSYVDTINLNTLNKHVYYTLMAVDRNQNQSPLSKHLEVSIPDKIKPQAPVFLPLKSDEFGVHLLWDRSGSLDVIRYEVYRQRSNEKEWMRIKTIAATRDSIYNYTDTTTTIAVGPNRYTVIAVDESELESEPSIAISASKIQSSLRGAVKWYKPIVDRANSQIVLNWEYATSGVETFRIYKARASEGVMLYKSLPFNQKQFYDKELRVGEKYEYYIMAVFSNGSKSTLSDVFTVNY